MNTFVQLHWQPARSGSLGMSCGGRHWHSLPACCTPHALPAAAPPCCPTRLLPSLPPVTAGHLGQGGSPGGDRRHPDAGTSSRACSHAWLLLWRAFPTAHGLPVEAQFASGVLPLLHQFMLSNPSVLLSPLQHCIPHDRSEDLRAEAAAAAAGGRPAAAAAAASKEGAEEEEEAGAAGMDVDVAGKEGGLPGSGAQPAE